MRKLFLWLCALGVVCAAGVVQAQDIEERPRIFPVSMPGDNDPVPPLLPGTLQPSPAPSLDPVVAPAPSDNDAPVAVPLATVPVAPLPNVIAASGAVYDVTSAGWRAYDIAHTAQVMSDGLLRPAAPSGLAAAITPDGAQVTLLINHRLREQQPSLGAYGPRGEHLWRVSRDMYYNPMPTLAYGGVTRMVLDGRSGAPIRQELALAGTRLNGPATLTPWGSVLSGEGEVLAAGALDIRVPNPPHGFIFELPIDTKGLTSPVPVPNIGPMAIAALAVDSAMRCIYVADEAGYLYRLRPSLWRELGRGGRWEVLVAENHSATPLAPTPGRRYGTYWAPMYRQGAEDVTAIARRSGGTRLPRITALAMRDSTLYLAITGDDRQGQLLSLDGRILAQTDASVGGLGPVQAMCVREDGTLVIADLTLQGPTRLRLWQRDGTWLALAMVNRSGVGGLAAAGAWVFVNIEDEGLTVGLLQQQPPQL